MRIKRILVVVTLALAFGLTSHVSLAQKRGPSTPEERAQAVRLARTLENDPLSDNTKIARAWLAKFWEEVPDLGVRICTDYFSPLLGKDKNYSGEIFLQMMFSSGAFLIENPDKAKDQMATDKAGVEGMLKTYEAVLKVKPKAKWSFLDDLIQKRDSGKLDEWISETSKKCDKPKK
jgi:carboxypeptidase Q